PRGTAPAWLRDRSAHRGPLPQPTEVSCGLALSVALSIGRTWVAEREMARKSRAAPPTLLSSDARRPSRPRATTRYLADVRARHEPDHGSQSCLTRRHL